MTTIDTIADRSTGTAVAGKMYFETSTNQLIAWTGSAWIELDSDGTGAASFENRWAASFDGSDKLAVSDSSLAINGDLTISLWFNANTFTNWNYIFNLTTFATVQDSKFEARSLGFYDTKLSSNTYYDGWDDVGATTLQTNTWYHAAVVYERTSGTDSGFHTLYLNGSVDKARTAVSMADLTYGETTLGESYNSERFNGYMDEVAVFDAALDASDISAMYNSGTPADLTLAGSYNTDRTSNLKAYWRMGDHSSDSASDGTAIASITDSSGNAVNLSQSTATNQPAFSDLTGETIYA